MRFLDVKTDFAFKKVFGSENSKLILIDFLNAMIDFGGDSITDLTIVDPYQIPIIRGMKDSYVDVKAVLSNKTNIIIEMQVLNVQGFEHRVLYNAAKSYSSQLMRAQAYNAIEPIIALTITDFLMFPEFAKVFSYWQLREQETLLKYNDDIQLIFAELPKFTKTEDELDGITDKWLYFIKNAGELDFVPESFTENALLEAFKMANQAGLEPEELEMQHKRRDFIILQRGSIEKAMNDGMQKGMQKGMEKGIEKGMKLGKTEVTKELAARMLNDKLPLDLIQKYTSLSIEQIEAIKHDLMQSDR